MKYKRKLEMGCTELLVSGCPFPGWKQKKTNTKQNNSNPFPPPKKKKNQNQANKQTNKKTSGHRQRKQDLQEVICQVPTFCG